MKAGHSAKSQKPADLHRNHLPACSGIGCRHAPEWGAALERIFHIHKIYSDEGLSGAKSANRPELQQLLTDAKKKRFEAVIISRLSRFGRHARELLNNVDILRKQEYLSYLSKNK